MGRQILERRISWQEAKHAKLYSDILQVFKERIVDSSLFSEDGILTSASMSSHSEMVDSA